MLEDIVKPIKTARPKPDNKRMEKSALLSEVPEIWPAILEAYLTATGKKVTAKANKTKAAFLTRFP